MVHILVLGATGPSGIAFCETALASGHQLTIFARSPSKLPAAIQSHPGVTTIKGEFSETEKVKEALSAGATVLVSFLGPTMEVMKAPAGTTPVTDFYEGVLFPMLKSKEGGSKNERIFVLSTPSFPDPSDRFSLLWKFMVLSIKWFFRAAYDEVNGIGRVTKKLDGIPWTVFRVPMLTNGEAKGTVAAYIGQGAKMALSRKSLAVWILQEMEQRKWIGQCPAVGNDGWI